MDIIMTEEEIKELKYKIWEGAMVASERRGRDGFAAAKKLIEYYEEEIKQGLFKMLHEEAAKFMESKDEENKDEENKDEESKDKEM